MKATHIAHSKRKGCMFVTVTAKAYADIIIFGDAALSTLKIMRYGATAPGAVRAEDAHVAPRLLIAAIDEKKASPPVEDKDTDWPVASMAHRAPPRVDLLAAVAKAESRVVMK